MGNTTIRASYETFVRLNKRSQAVVVNIEIQTGHEIEQILPRVHAAIEKQLQADEEARTKSDAPAV